MSPLGESRRFGDVRATSALFLIADVRREDRQVRKVPRADIVPLDKVDARPRPGATQRPLSKFLFPR